MKSVSTQMPPQGHIATINGMQMYYEIHGEGPPLLLLHGFFTHSQVWKPFIDTFSNAYRLIIPDLRGHGRSTNPSDQFTHRQSALDIYALLDQLEIDHFRAMGISTGGQILFHMATGQPARVEAMVVIGATIYYPDQTRAFAREITPESADIDWEVLRQRHVRGDAQIRALINQFHDGADNYDDMNFTPSDLSTITAKTLIVHGDRDRIIPVSIPVEMYTFIPDAYLWIIPNGDHIPIMDERAAVFMQTALEFLQGNWE